VFLVFLREIDLRLATPWVHTLWARAGAFRHPAVVCSTTTRDILICQPDDYLCTNSGDRNTLDHWSWLGRCGGSYTPSVPIISPSIHHKPVWFSSTKLAKLALVKMCVDKKKYEGFGRHVFGVYYQCIMCIWKIICAELPCIVPSKCSDFDFIMCAWCTSLMITGNFH